ncbi:MAG: orotidine-5'-phosphate decarboxylase [Gammaproteobacteria bacterium]
MSEPSTGPAGPRIIVALDFADADAARALVERLDPTLCRVKVGKELFTRAGPEFVSGLVAAGYDVFLDLKFHDIPNTVARACAAAADLGVWMLNVHALGGRRMMESARQALESASGTRPLLVAVTVLTSLDEADLGEIGLTGTPADNVERLAALAQSSGLDGVVCSAREAAGLRAGRGAGFVLVTPGIRPGGSERSDQKRVMTPGDAIRAGSDYLVVGRPVTQAQDPLASLVALNREIAA